MEIVVAFVVTVSWVSLFVSTCVWGLPRGGSGGKAFGSGSVKLMTAGIGRRFHGLSVAVVDVDWLSEICLLAVEMIPDKAEE